MNFWLQEESDNRKKEGKSIIFFPKNKISIQFFPANRTPNWGETNQIQVGGAYNEHLNRMKQNKVPDGEVPPKFYLDSALAEESKHRLICRMSCKNGHHIHQFSVAGSDLDVC
jgi:hypothetical protein